MSEICRVDFIGSESSLKQVLDDAEKAAKYDFPVLILGETGTGKSKLAEYIHAQSNRSEKPFVTVDIGAIPGELLESELFGYGKGAFTGAKKEGSDGFIKSAHTGTLFIDEISNAHLDIQAKLLRFIQTKKYRPLGVSNEIEVDTRIIVATNDKITTLVECNNFRADLYYRLKNVVLRLPSLKDQLELLPVLTQQILDDINKKYSIKKEIMPDAIKLMMDHPHEWPGNIRELQGTVNRLVALSPGDKIDKEIAKEIFQRQTDRPELMNESIEEANHKTAMAHFERTYLLKALIENDFNKTKTAASIGMEYKTLMRKFKKYGLLKTNSNQ